MTRWRSLLPYNYTLVSLGCAPERRSHYPLDWLFFSNELHFNGVFSLKNSVYSKLSKFKKWQTLPDAAKHLSYMWGVDITEADILRFALDGHLKLSVCFVNQTKARRGIVVGREDVKWGEFSRDLDGIVPNLVVEAEGEILRYMESVKLDDTRFLNLSDEETTIEGVWDLHMIGSGRLNIENKYQRLIGGPRVDFQDLGGPVVESSDRMMYQLGKNRYANLCFSPRLMAQIAKLRRLELSQSNNRRIEKLLVLRRERVKSSKEIEIKLARLERVVSNKLPEDSVLVLRTEVLEDFTQRMLDSEAGENTATKVHGNAERHAANREQVLGAALSVVTQWPNQCQNKSGKFEATKIAKLIDEKSLLYWPETGEAPLGREKMEREISKWIKGRTAK